MQGLILLNKPKGITSFSAVASLRRIAKEKRIGHTGTLDPMAEGVLPILLGRATSLSSLLLDGDKHYIAGIKLGIKTDTDDITGKVLAQGDVNITNEQLLKALEKFKGIIKQKPPIYSALKRDGVRLYQLAREGKLPEVVEREIEIFDIKLISPLDKDNSFTIAVHVSKGTYIRSLARDIGEYLGCNGTLCSLIRSRASSFDIKDCVKLDELTEQNINSFLLSEEKVVDYLEEIKITASQAKRFCNGGQLSFERLAISNPCEGQLFRVKHNNIFLGVGFADLDREQIGIKCIINYPENRD